VGADPFAEGAAEGVDGRRIERELAGDAANAVGAEELAGHGLLLQAGFDTLEVVAYGERGSDS
jgi:hypothetical protein